MPKTSSLKRSVKGVTLLYTVLSLLIIALTLAGLSTYLTFETRNRARALNESTLHVQRLTTGKEIYLFYCEKAYSEPVFTPYESLRIEGLTYPDLVENQAVTFRNSDTTIAYAVGDIRFYFNWIDADGDKIADEGEFSSLRSEG